MVRLKTLLEEFRTCSGPFKYQKLVKLLSGVGYELPKSNGGSGRRFRHPESKHLILLHEPHPGDEFKPYLVRQIREALRERNLL